jgi:hypothetical protein
MKIRKAISRVTLMVLLAASLGGAPNPASAKTTDESDLWWIPTESGWGIQFVQEEDTIFATMFVYGPDGKPTWYVATLNYLGSLTWTGTLYATTGPWFGTVPFDPTSVVGTPIGTMNLSVPLVNQAMLTYTVSGVTVVKVIQRQTLVSLNFNGLYNGTLSQTGTGLTCNQGANTNAAPAGVQITQTGPTMTVTTQTNTDICTFSGSYTQGGHFGRVAGVYNCASGDSGTFTIFEMAVSFYDFRARTLLNSNSGCTIKGYINGLKQPPPPQ